MSMEKIEYYFNKPLPFELIADTFKMSYKKDLDYKYWHWRFIENPVDSKVYIIYILIDGVLAAYYAVSPCLLEAKGQAPRKIALSNMTMTHPDYQGKGLFTKIAQGLYKELENDGYSGIIGFANKNSHYGFRKNLNWHDLAALTLFKVSPEAFRSNLSVENLGFKIHSFDFTESHLNDIAGLDFATNDVFIPRNKEYLNWRLVQNPVYQYFILNVYKDENVLSSAIYKFFGGEIDIMEFFYNPEYSEIKNKLLELSIAELNSKYKTQINIWSNLHTEEHLYLENWVSMNLRSLLILDSFHLKIQPWF